MQLHCVVQNIKTKKVENFWSSVRYIHILFFIFCTADGDLNGNCTTATPCKTIHAVCDNMSGRCECDQGYSQYNRDCVEGIVNDYNNKLPQNCKANISL